jgi:hypothetical protein
MPKLLPLADQRITNSKPPIFVFAWKASPHCSSDKFSIEAANDSNLAQLALTASQKIQQIQQCTFEFESRLGPRIFYFLLH